MVTSQCRSRQNSLAEAKETILTRLENRSRIEFDSEISSDRKKKVGSGMRGDKIRTYRFQDDIVKDDRTGKSASTTKVLKGHFDLLWD